MIAMSILALLIFVADTVTVLDIAVATLYVLVVLLSAKFGSTRIVVTVGAGCIALAVISWSLTRPAGPIFEGIVNELISNLTIALVTLLTVRTLQTEQKHRYQASLLELTRDAFFTWDMSGKIIYWNRGAEALYGFDRTVAVGKVTHTLFGTEFAMPLEQIMERLHQNNSWEGQFVRRRADGTPRIVSCRLTLQRDAAARASMILETNNDVTERVQLEDALEQARPDLVRMNRVLVLGEMTASIAHEIKQPIAAMMTSAAAALNWLDHDPPEGQKAGQAVTRIINDGNRAVEVLARVRSLIKKAPPRAGRWDLNEAVDEVIALTRSDIARNGVQLIREVAEGALFVTGDRVQVQQVIINLIVNAVEAMHGLDDSNRELTVVTGAADHGCAFIQVRDTGVGIQEGELAHLSATVADEIAPKPAPDPISHRRENPKYQSAARYSRRPASATVRPKMRQAALQAHRARPLCRPAGRTQRTGISVLLGSRSKNAKHPFLAIGQALQCATRFGDRNH